MQSLLLRWDGSPATMPPLPHMPHLPAPGSFACHTCTFATPHLPPAMPSCHLCLPFALAHTHFPGPLTPDTHTVPAMPALCLPCLPAYHHTTSAMPSLPCPCAFLPWPSCMPFALPFLAATYGGVGTARVGVRRRGCHAAARGLRLARGAWRHFVRAP